METDEISLYRGKAILSLAEFASYFGKEKTWAYRMMYAGKIEVIQGYGKLMIPVGEISKILQTKHRYLGRK